MVEFKLSEQQLMLKNMAKDFVEKELKPVAAELDRKQDPKECFSWDLLRKASKLGLRTMTLPEEWGGMNADILTRVVLGEELAVGDLGFTVCLDQIWKICSMICHLSTDEQKQRFLPAFRDDDEYVLSICVTEPGSGSDGILPYENPDYGIKTLAKLEGDEWVINGTKHFISNAGLSKLYLLFARTDPEASVWEGISTFLVPHDAPGFSIGRVEDKMGQRLTWNSECVFNNCRIPKDNLLGELGRGLTDVVQFIVREGSNIQAGATVLGTARAAYEAAVEYAKERVQGGKPIIQHQAIQLLLTDCRMKIDAARYYLWKAAWNASSGEEEVDPSLAMLSKIFAAEISFEVCKKALTVFGSYGYMRDFPMEKYLRDATSFLHSDGCNQILALKAARVLYDLPPFK